jgi:nucleoside 2-deoxyribosyltransferase
MYWKSAIVRGRRRFRVYLAGCMSGRDADEVRGERAEAALLLRSLSDPADVDGGLDVVPVDPAEGENLRSGVVGPNAVDYEMPSDRFMVERDFALVESCNAVLVLTADVFSAGTFFEWAYARFIGRPVFAVTADAAALGSWRRALSTAQGGLAEMVAAVVAFARSL